MHMLFLGFGVYISGLGVWVLRLWFWVLGFVGAARH